MQNGSAIRALILVVVSGACSSEPASTQSESTLPPTAQSALTSPETSRPATTPPKIVWTVSELGVGPIRAGMTLQQVRPLLPGLRTAAGRDDLATAPCTYARAPSLPSGVALMFENGQVARVDILTGGTRTVNGAGIGDTEARLQSLYKGRVKVSPHKYTDGHYLSVTLETDTARKIVFETDGFKVLRFRSGKIPAVDYVEGCS